ncbi:hypothetical protein W97_00143 [Coniosporium apollinis CBS 100218]|uniref:Uncharacterized protein n=1 Tax=Coniosporium apollinis (strain CBS 100218) TaxID=1168221 RepID=R7YGB9_CONA1|nr:uncharacterized protein W97_00143 [Coniosporium apollinis CBS 100218]EON60933.1 hypothetical protein W97_00143 [Coniosporium apollinis CBS 100218]
MPSLLSLVFAPSANAQHSWRQQAISSQQVFSNVEVSNPPHLSGTDVDSLPQFLAHQNPYRVKALSSQEFLLTFEEPQTLYAIPDLPADQKDWSSIAARIVSALPTSIWRDTRDRQLILYTPPILLPGLAQPSDLPLVLAPRPVTHSGDLKPHETSRRSEFAVECLNSNWAHFYLQQQSLAARGVFRRTCFKKKDVPVPAYKSSTRYFAEDQGGFYGVDVDTPDSSTTPQDAYSAPIIEEEGEMAPTIVSTQMEPVAEASQGMITTEIEPAKAAEAQDDPYVFEFPDEEEELEQLIREEAPRDLERMADRARKNSLVSIDETSEAQTNDEVHLTPPEEATHYRLDEEEDSEANTDVETDLATPEEAMHYRLSDKVHDYENESEEAAHEVQNEELHQDVDVVAMIQSASLDVHAELENLPRRAYEVPDGAEVDPYWAPYEHNSLVPESTKTSPEVCVWTTTHHEDLNFYEGHVRKGWDENQGEEHDAFRRHVLSASAWSHVYVMDPTSGYKVPYGAMNRRLAEEVYEPGTSGIKRKWWYKPGAKGFKETVDPETQTNRKTFCPRRSRLTEAQSASDDADEDSYVSASDFDQTPAEEFQHLYAGLSQDILDGGEASDWSDFGSKRSEDDDVTEEEGFEEAAGSNVEFAFDDEGMTSQSVREACADARSGSLNGRQSRFGLRDEDLDSVASDTELLGSSQAVKRSLSAPPSLYRETSMAGIGGDERDVEEDSLLLEQDEDSYDGSVEYTADDEPTFGDAHIVVMQRQARVFGQDDDALDSSMIQDHHEENAEKDAASGMPEDMSFENGQENDTVGADQKGGPEVDNITDEGRDEDGLILQDLSIATPPPAAV